MATAILTDEVLSSTRGKANFQRVARLLISGGTTLLREIFDLRCPPSNLPTILKNPATKKNLKAAKFTKPQWDCLYPSPGVYGKSTDFDVSLLFKLLRTICSLSPPVTGWDALPASTDHSLAAELARIKYNRNSVYGHVNQTMEIKDDEFPLLWQEISEALLGIAGQIGHTKRNEWQEAIDNFLTESLTDEDERNIQELFRWYKNDVEVKNFLEDLKNVTQEGIGGLEETIKNTKTGLEKKAEVIAEGIRDLKTVVREQAEGTKSQLQEKMEDVLKKVQERIDQLQTSVNDIQNRLHENAESVSKIAKKFQCFEREFKKLRMLLYSKDSQRTSASDLQLRNWGKYTESSMLAFFSGYSESLPKENLWWRKLNV
ncbi:uncharacterized protein LOC144629733 [Oculina patagonica]